jgi:type I restriction enzyme, S subunit
VLREWKGTLIPSDDLEDFREKCFPIAHLENADDHILRALSQLAGLGFIAQVSVPNQLGEYVVGYRGLRDGERVLPSDLQSALES